MGIFVYDAETETELEEVGEEGEGEVLCRNRNVNSAAAVEPRILTFLKQPFINNLFTGAGMNPRRGFM